MSAWLESMQQIGEFLLGNPASLVETAVIGVAAVLVLMFVLSKAGSAFGISNTGFFYSLVVAMLGIVLLLVCMTAVKLYLPAWENEGLRVWLLVGTGVVASLVLVVPLMCGIQRTGYVSALLTWLCSAAAAAVVIALVGGAFSLFSSGSRSADSGLQHRRQIEEALE